MSPIDEKLKAIPTDLEIDKRQSQIDSLSQPVSSTLKKLQVVENGDHPHSIYRSQGEPNTFFKKEKNPLNNADIPIISSNIPQEPNILEISKELINTLNK